MKKDIHNDNRYARAIEQIVPDQDFVNDTVKKLTRAKSDKASARFMLAGVSALAVVAIVLGITLFSSGLFGGKNGSTASDQGKNQYASAQTKETAQPASDSTTLPTSLPTPNPTMLPAYDLNKAGAAPVMYATESYETEEFGAWDMSYYYADMPWNTEEYSFIAESGFKNVLTSPQSTFAADVDTAGYTTVRRRLLNGRLPDDGSVRIEEMLNYFHYIGLAPTDGAPAAISAYLGACPWNDKAALMFVGIGARSIDTENLPKSNLVFLIDTSGSMDGSDRLDLAKRAFHLLADTLSEGDTVSIVTYSGSFRVLLEGADAADTQTILNVIDSLEASGGTNGGDAIKTAYAIAEKYFIEGGNNRVILMTDGDLNLGITSESELVSLIEEKKQTGVFLSVLGFGTGNYKDSKLEALADHGNGVYSYIDGITEARRVLVTEMGATFYTVAKDVKIQVEFNPEYVASYRLIGYENRQMAAEDFSDDTKDGGEMGSGHTVVALYELIPAEGKTIAGVTGTEDSASASGLRYQQTAPTGLEEVASVSIRYKDPDADESSLISLTVKPDDLALGEQARNLAKAAAIAEFGMVLRDSEYKGSATYDSAYQLISGLGDPTPEEAELMYLIDLARQIG